MKNIWNSRLKEAVILFCVIYTVTTILNSILYLAQGIVHDPNGNWHELTRAAIVLIGVLAYELAIYLPIKNTLLKAVVVYVITMPLVLLTVWLSGFADPLSPGAYTDIAINYTGLFLVVSLIAVITKKMNQKKH